MGYVQILIAAIGLARELIKYLREKDDDRYQATQKVINFKHAVRAARKEGTSEYVEKAFADFGFSGLPNTAGDKKSVEPKII